MIARALRLVVAIPLVYVGVALAFVAFGLAFTTFGVLGFAAWLAGEGRSLRKVGEGCGAWLTQH